MNADSPTHLSRMSQRIMLVGILCIAALLRFYNLSHQGFMVSDEGGYVLGAATTMLEAHDVTYTFYRPGFITLVILSGHLVGWLPLAGQAPSAVLGVLTVAIIYGLTRQFFSQPAALIATALVATSTYHVFYSRVGLSNATALFFFTAGLLCWVRFHTNRQGLRLYPFAAGLMFGYAVTCHYQFALYLILGGLVELWLAARARVVHGTVLLLLGVLIPLYGFYGEVGVGYLGSEILRLSHVVQLSAPDPFYYLRLFWRYETFPLTVFSILGLLRAVQTLRQGRPDTEGAFYVLFAAFLVALSIGAARGQAAPRLMSSLFPFLAVLVGGGATLLLDSARVQRGRSLLQGAVLVLILLSGVFSNLEALSWHSRFAEAADALQTRYPTSEYACSGGWAICGFYQLGPQVNGALHLNDLMPRAEFLFSTTPFSSGRLLASFDDPTQRHPMVVEENAPGSVLSGQPLQIPGVIYVYDLRPDPFSAAAFIAHAQRGDTQAVRALVAAGVHPSARDTHGATALMRAAAKGHTETVDFLLAAGADVIERTTALIFAAAHGHTAIVQTLLAHGAQVNARTQTGETALMGAAAQGHTAVVQALLASGADVNAKTQTGATALMGAAANGHTAVVQLLKAAGAKDDRTPVPARRPTEELMARAARGDTEAVNALVAAGVNPNATDKVGATALLLAAASGYPAPVEALLAAGANVNAKTQTGATALMGAAANGHTAVVQVLLTAGADVNATMLDGRTALMFAAADGHAATVHALLAGRAAVNARQRRGTPVPIQAAAKREGATALMRAAANGHLAVVEALIAAGADVNAKTPAGATALMAAAIDGHLATVEALLAHGAEANARQVNGWTALMGAGEGGHPSIGHLLKQAGAKE